MQINSNRRALLAGAFVLSAGAAGAAHAQSGLWPFGRRSSGQTQPPPQQPAGEHDHMEHMHHGEGADFVLTEQESATVRALAGCSTAGEVCLSHCIETLSAGDVSMAACAHAVRDMLTICRATQTLIQTHSMFAGQQLALCRDACTACRSECTPHAAHHATCRACAEACAASIAAIDALLG
ncbi:MAG: Csp1 family four helix bundle copper storage protein [Terricaulis sp.]